MKSHEQTNPASCVFVDRFNWQRNIFWKAFAFGSKRRAGMPANRRQGRLRSAVRRSLRHRQILYEAPIAARIDVNIPDGLFGNHHVGLVPQRKHRHISTNYLLSLRV